MKTNPELWTKISTLPFEQDAVPFGFARRLARDNCWSHDFAHRVVEEYRRFAYLAVVTDHEVTPSDEVDQVWHLHMTYTRHYWGPFQEVLGRPLHHGPTQGTASDKQRFDDNYASTLTSYAHEFGEAPPADIWPAAKIRFGDAPYYQRINTATHLVVPMPRALRRIVSARSRMALGFLSVLGISGLTFASAHAALAADSGGNMPLGFLLFGLVLLIAVIVLVSARNAGKASAKKSGSGCGAGYAGTNSGKAKADADGDGGGDGGSGCGGGGCGGGCGG